MEPYSRFCSGGNEWGEEYIPIIVRSKKDGDHI